MPGHKVGANGRLCINSQGRAILCDCATCAYCNAGTVPNSWTLVASGIDNTSIIGMCFNWFAGSANVLSTPNPNGTFTLSVLSDCVWSYTLANTGQIRTFTDRSCSVSPTTRNFLGISWTLYRTSGLWELEFNLQDGTTAYSMFDMKITTAAVVDCNNSLSGSNQQSGLGTTSALGFVIGQGGSVILTPA